MWTGGTVAQLWFSKARDSWVCDTHGHVTLDAAGRPSCGCSVIVMFDRPYVVPRVDKKNLPTASRKDAK